MKRFLILSYLMYRAKIYIHIKIYKKTADGILNLTQQHTIIYANVFNSS